MKILCSKKQDELAKKVIENYLISKEALAYMFPDKEEKEFFETLGKLIENTVDLLIGIVGAEKTPIYLKHYNLTNLSL